MNDRMDENKQSEPGRSKPTRWDWFALILPLMALAPLLWFQSNLLWNKPHLQFFPMALVCLVGFLYTSKWSGSSPISPFRKWIAHSLVLLGYGTALMATFLFSPWLAHLALFGFIAGWGLGRLEGESWTRLIAVNLLILLILPLPFNFDTSMIQGLQTYSAKACSAVLDAVDMPHYPQGNVLRVKTKQLFVEEACSGVGSLYTLAAIAMIILLSNREGFLLSVMTFSTVPLWAGLGNLIRLVSIALALELFQIDLTEETPHTILGLVVFGIAGLGLWSTHTFLSGFLGPIKIAEKTNAVVVTLAKFYNFLVAWPSRVTEAVGAEDKRKDVELNIMGYGSIMPNLGWFAVTVLLLSVSVLPAYVVWKSPKGATIRFSEEVAASFPSNEAFPSAIGNWELKDYHQEQRSHMSTFGEFSNIWRYTRSDEQFLFSLDFPFRGWHGLWGCYENTGWKVVDLKIVDRSAKAPDEWTYVEVQFVNELQSTAYLWFSLFDENGAPFEAIGAEVGDTIETRFALSLSSMLERALGKVIEPVTYQVQLFRESGKPLNDQEKSQLREMFLQMRSSMREKTMPILSQLTSGN